MKLLLDTHILICYGQNSPMLPKKFRELIVDPDNQIFVSIVTLFEIAIKIKVGKLNLGSPIANFREDLLNDNLETLPITLQHLTAYNTLPLFDAHRDPFDRLLLATALSEGFSLISLDKKFGLYKEMVEIIGF